jgi:hypothetical protein
MTEPTKIEVAALVVAPDILTFFKTDGSVFTVTQGDPRGVELSDEFFRQRKAGAQIVTLLLTAEQKTATHLNSAKRNPLIRFFRAKLADVEKLFGKDAPGEYEKVEPNDLTDASLEAAELRVKQIASQLMASSKDVAEGTHDLPLKMVHSEEPMGKDETIIGVTEDGIVPHVESLNDQFKASDEGKASATGPDNLVIRLAKMSAKRGHTAAELLRFIKGIDLPILPDGSFLAYKRLKHIGKGVYVDPHTSRVHQRIGDIVQMDETLVDPNRRQACSQGLHVGTRHYMGSFHSKAEGSGTMLVLIQPEDAIAVPINETTKMRASRYLILADLSNKAHDLVNKNKRMDDCKETMQIVAQIVAGARPPLLGVVNISQGAGQGLEYRLNGVTPPTNISLEEARDIAQSKATAPQGVVTDVRTIDDAKNGNMSGLKPEVVRDKSHVVKPIDAKAKAEASTPAPTPVTPQPAKPTATSVRAQVAAQLYARMTDKDNTDKDRLAAATELKAHKQRCKVSYDFGLGLPSQTGTEIEEIIALATPATKADPKPSKSAPKQPDPKAKAKADRKPEPVKTAPQPKQAAKVKAKPEPKAEPAKAPANESRGDKARRLWAIVIDKKTSHAANKQALEELIQFKKSAKVSWEKLGLYTHTVEAEMKKHSL